MKKIVNGISRTVPALKGPSTDLQFAFKSKNQGPLFMLWRAWYDANAEVEFGLVLFNSMDWVGI